ncbi:MAG: acetylxylan esterase [Herbiconiux sp.]|nr:acetylxylan esterase [Herbiconiux sp.]
MITDLDPAGLAAYRSAQTEPEGFDDFWRDTLAASREAARAPGAATLRVEPVDTGLRTVEVFDVTFPGFAGQPIRAWLRLPAGRDPEHPLPAVVQYVGYGGGRGRAWENLFWASAGFAHLQMDTRGQGSVWSAGDTADQGAPGGPQTPGFMTRGIDDPADYYYRRLVTDAVRAVDAARALPAIDADRIAVVGHSQGGGLALAVSALVPGLRAAAFSTPFLCDFPRAVFIAAAPYSEIATYLAVHRESAARVHRTLSFFDGVNFARRATVPALFSAALMDPITPPSTIAGAQHVYAGTSALELWPYNGHEGGGPDEDHRLLRFFDEHLRGDGERA